MRILSRPPTLLDYSNERGRQGWHKDKDPDTYSRFVDNWKMETARVVREKTKKGT